MRDTVTIFVPEGYESSTAFLNDCGFESLEIGANNVGAFNDGYAAGLEDRDEKAQRTTAMTASAEPVAWRYRIVIPNSSGPFEWMLSDSYPEHFASRFPTMREIEPLYAALSAAPVSAWQDISTAPIKPVDEVESYYRFNCLLQNEQGWVKAGWAEYTHHKKKLVWKSDNGQSFYPIYWMPLPAPRHDETGGGARS